MARTVASLSAGKAKSLLASPRSSSRFNSRCFFVLITDTAMSQITNRVVKGNMRVRGVPEPIAIVVRASRIPAIERMTGPIDH